MNDRITISVYPDKKLKKKLDKLAKKEDRSLNKIIIQILEKELHNKKVL